MATEKLFISRSSIMQLFDFISKHTPLIFFFAALIFVGVILELRCLNIIGNWFEVNYEKEKINTKYAVDIYCSNDIKAENDSFQTNLINALFHKELIDVAKGTAYGSINIRDNCHVKTPHGIIFSYFNYGRISISGETFTGDSSFNNKPILIRSSGNNYYNTVINVSDIREQNTSGNTSITNKRMTSGKDGKLLFMDDNFSHTGILEINYN
jgi:hypothetical protein